MKSKATGIAAVLWVISFLLLIYSRDAGYPYENAVFISSMVFGVCAFILTVILVVQSIVQLIQRLRNKDKLTLEGGFWYWAAVISFLFIIVHLILFYVFDQKDPDFQSRFYNIIRLIGLGMTFLALPIQTIYAVEAFMGKEKRKLPFLLVFFMLTVNILLIGGIVDSWYIVRTMISQFKPH
jgi:hypothetical protein